MTRGTQRRWHVFNLLFWFANPPGTVTYHSLRLTAEVEIAKRVPLRTQDRLLPLTATPDLTSSLASYLDELARGRGGDAAIGE